MPSLKTRVQQPIPVQARIEIPADFPDIPQEILDRFPSASDWQRRLQEFWTRADQAIQAAQVQVANQVNSQVVFSVDTFKIYGPNNQALPMFFLDGTGVRLGNVLVVNTAGKTVHIGVGQYANDNTPFYVDTFGNFSLGSNFAWDAASQTLNITGTINATSGTIGGFTISATDLSANPSATTFFSMSSTGYIRMGQGAVGTSETSLDNTNLTIQTISSGALSTVITRTSVTVAQTAGGLSVGIGAAALTLISTAASLTTTLSVSTLDFGGDTNLYRSAANVLKTDDNFQAASGIDSTAIGATTPSSGSFTTLLANNTVNFTNGLATVSTPGTDSILGIYNSGTGGKNWQIIGASNGSGFTSGHLVIYDASGSILAVDISTTALTLNGTISTGAPTVGAAGAWKLGKYTAGVIAQAGKIRVNVDNVDYDLLTA